MANALQLRRGTTAQHSTFTGLAGEVTVDTDKDTVVVHDGSTAGGIPLAKEASLSSYATTASLSGYATTASLSSYATTASLSSYATTASLATVATTGAYADLTGTPTLATVATSGAYTDLSGTPTLATVATTGAYSDLSGTPSASDLLTSIKTVDGPDSGLDADTLDGKQLATLESEYQSYADTAVSNLVAAAPATLDTLNELAAALGDDPNFATTVTNSIATKMPLAGGTFTGNITAPQYSGGLADVVFNADVKEKTTISATAASGTVAFDVLTQQVLFYTSNASGNFTVNIRGDGSNTLNSLMATGDSITLAFFVTNGGTAYYNTAVQVDGVSVTPKWQGGSAPTSGNASSVDIYTYTVIKTGSATFSVFASQTQFA